MTHVDSQQVCYLKGDTGLSSQHCIFLFSKRPGLHLLVTNYLGPNHWQKVISRQQKLTISRKELSKLLKILDLISDLKKENIAPDKDWRQLGIYPPLFDLIGYFKF